MSAYRIGNVEIMVLQGDITNQEVDAIVNAANSRLAGGGGVDGAIHRAGGPSIMEECRKIGYCPTGDAVVTGAGNLKARYVIHAVGPVWKGGHMAETEILAQAYKNSLKRAKELGVRTVAFPAISSGAYGFPMDVAAHTAIKAIRDEIAKDPGSIEQVRIVLFHAPAYQAFEKACQRLLRSG